MRKYLKPLGLALAAVTLAAPPLTAQELSGTLKKIKDTGSVARKKGSGRPKKITGSASIAIGQYLRRDPLPFLLPANNDGSLLC